MQLPLGGRLIVLTLAIIIVAASLGSAEFIPDGSEFQVNDFTRGFQGAPVVAADPTGGFVVVWDGRRPGGEYGTTARRYDDLGNARGPSFQIKGGQALATDSSGGFVVAWQNSDIDGDSYGLLGQRYNSEGREVGAEFQVNSFTTGYQYYPAIAADSSGGFIVVWTSGGFPTAQDGDRSGVFGQRYDSAGEAAGNEFQVNTYSTGRQLAAQAATTPSNDFVVVWQSSDQDGDDYGVFAQRYSSAGDKVGSEFQINTYTAGYQSYPAIATDPAGGFIVVWTSGGFPTAQDGDRSGVFGQRYAGDGETIGAEFQVNTHTSGRQRSPVVATDSPHGFVVVWESSPVYGIGQDGGGSGIFGQRYDTDGREVGDEFQINTYTTGSQFSPALVSHGPGLFVVVWQSEGQDGDGDGIFAQRFVDTDLLPTPTPEPPACAGDCDRDGQVTIDELIIGVNIALGSASVQECPPIDLDGDGEVAINELVAAVGRALNGCG